MQRVNNIEIHEQRQVPLVLNLLRTKFHKEISEFWARMIFTFQTKILALYEFFKNKEKAARVDVLYVDEST